ncbi:MAG: GNAT family N-acetyltransferase [Streptosporangiaceae bacterium]
MNQYAKEQLAAILWDAAKGSFPPADGGVTVLPQPTARDAGVWGFTAHAIVFADVEPDWVVSQLPADNLSAPLGPPFLQALSAATNRRPGSIDMLCFGEPLAGPPPIDLTREPDLSHPRVARALSYRDDVQAWRTADGGGVVLLGRGVAGRRETAIEVDETRRSRGLGRALAAAARHLAEPGEPLWAQVAPGNAASVRAFLAAGFSPVGAEILLARITPERPE